jgi:hypothetical protein
MENKNYILSSVTACTRPLILVGDDSPVGVTEKRRVELNHGIFENFLHVTQLFMNMLSLYQITNIGLDKMVEFTSDSMSIFNMQDNCKIVVGEVNHKYQLYTFTKFIELDSSIRLTHVDDSSRLWHTRFGHLNFRYMH